ncbi:MAG: dihydrodipicolinate synthase family protein [Thaumarchaeota archaeon]|nr:dihydrodipicolinate synthase family protein [Nitrososphaerota archaeon]
MLIDKNFEGVICALMTPFKADGSLDLEMMKRHVEILSKSRLRGFYPCGSSGEAPKMTHEERMKVIRAVVDGASHKVPVFAGGGGTTTEDSLRAAKDSKDAGADAVVLLPPYYYHPTQEALLEHYSTVAKKSDLPIFLYNVPNLAGYSLHNDTVTTLVKNNSNIVGIKDSSGDMINFGNLIADLDGRAGVFQGLEPLILPSLVMGASGAAVSDANVAPDLTVGIVDSFRAKEYDMAFKNQRDLTRLDNALGIADFILLTKEALRLMGRPFGATRKPSTPVTSAQTDHIKKTLLELKLL